jgi:hypothetical protein
MFLTDIHVGNVNCVEMAKGPIYRQTLVLHDIIITKWL